MPNNPCKINVKDVLCVSFSLKAGLVDLWFYRLIVTRRYNLVQAPSKARY